MSNANRKTRLEAHLKKVNRNLQRFNIKLFFYMGLVGFIFVWGFAGTFNSDSMGSFISGAILGAIGGAIIWLFFGGIPSLIALWILRDK
ncbi:MAG: hypothetical protein KDJ65_23635 [Anaerolineae bacterium]|nr:hypothetical protein [Anaerolineae bacterium]